MGTDEVGLYVPEGQEEKWDLRFLEMAKLVSGWSKDPSTKTGAVIVDSLRVVLAVGFNGFPRDMEVPDTLYHNREEKYSRIIHCEMNALLHAGALPAGCTLYTYPFMSCDRCAVHMIQAGIQRFVAPISTDEQFERWGVSFVKAHKYMNEADCLLQLYDWR